MASKVINCNSPSRNVVISEVLAFISNKIHVMDEESISRVCISAFSASDIDNARELLLKSMSITKQKIITKNNGITLRNIDDIICILKEADPEELPIFVARDLQKLTRVLSDHDGITRLFKDLLKIQGEIDVIKERYTTEDQMQRIQFELHSSKDTSIVNKNRTRSDSGSDSFEDACSDSVGLPHKCVKEDKKIIVDLSNKGGRCNTLLPERVKQSVEAQATLEANELANQRPLPRRSSANAAKLAPTQAPRVSAQTSIHTNAPNEHVVTQNQKPLVDNVRDGKCTPETDDEDDEAWIQVEKRRPRDHIAGNRNAVLDPRVKSYRANFKIAVYVYNVPWDMAVCDLVNYIKNKSNVIVRLQKLEKKVAKGAYKFYVPKCKLEIFLNIDFWPEGIFCRRFVNIDQHKDRVNILKNDKVKPNHDKPNHNKQNHVKPNHDKLNHDKQNHVKPNHDKPNHVKPKKQVKL